MAGKKGMKHRRPKTQEERDQYAKTKIEELLDAFVLNGKAVAGWTPARLKALEIRYNKLRASLSSTELTDKREGWIDVMKRLASSKAHVQPQQSTATSVSGQPDVVVSETNVSSDGVKLH